MSTATNPADGERRGSKLSSVAGLHHLSWILTMAKLLWLLPLTGLVLLSLTAAPSSCKVVVLDSHLASLVRREVKSDGAGGPGDVVNDVGDQKVYDGQKNNVTDEFKELVASDLSDNDLQALMIVEDTKFGAEAGTTLILVFLKNFCEV